MSDRPVAGKERDTAFIVSAFASVLGRNPSPDEIAYGLAQLSGKRDARDYFLELNSTGEASERQRQLQSAPLFVHPGHYYSPICDIKDLERQKFLDDVAHREMIGIDLAPVRQRETFTRLANHFLSIRFPLRSQSDFRYYSENDFYGIGDALILSAMIQEYKPNQIVEVGSGFSSAVILDTLDRLGGHGRRARCTFVEPYPDRLRGLLREDDLLHVSILENGVQAVDLDLFKSLERNDILFLDTTHISRTGSDVNYEVFEILPRLRPGVLVHFHDVFFNFEYPADWVLQQNRSWNEIYLLRAFLMHNNSFDIVFFNHHFACTDSTAGASEHQEFASHPGGGIWLQKR